MKELRQKLERLKGEKDKLKSQIKDLKRESREIKRDLIQYEEAQIVIQQVARITQEQLEYHISEIVTLAMSAVFDDPFGFEIEFVEKRGKTEAELWFVRNGAKIKPIDASGGGVVDVAAFALRVALWNIASPKTRSTIILDEPGKMISAGLRDKFGLMLNEISHKLDLQLIIVTHAEELMVGADNVIKIGNRKGKSFVHS